MVNFKVPSDDSMNRPDLAASVGVHFFSDHLIAERLGGKFSKGYPTCHEIGLQKDEYGNAGRLNTVHRNCIVWSVRSAHENSLPPF